MTILEIKKMEKIPDEKQIIRELERKRREQYEKDLRNPGPFTRLRDSFMSDAQKAELKKPQFYDEGHAVGKIDLDDTMIIAGETRSVAEVLDDSQYGATLEQRKQFVLDHFGVGMFAKLQTEKFAKKAQFFAGDVEAYTRALKMEAKLVEEAEKEAARLQKGWQQFHQDCKSFQKDFEKAGSKMTKPLEARWKKLEARQKQLEKREDQIDAKYAGVGEKSDRPFARYFRVGIAKMEAGVKE